MKQRFILAALLLATPAAAQQPPWYGGAATGTTYPNFSIPIVASATGTNAATTVTLPGIVGKTTFICGFSATSSNATTANGGNITVSGLVPAGTLNFAYEGPATGQGVLVVPFRPCIPASAPNTPIVITAPAAGAGSNQAASAWGYQSGT